MSTFTAGDDAPLLRVLARYTELDEDDRAALMQLDTGPLCTAGGRTDLAREGDHPTHIRLLVSGWACRYKDLADGRRQIVGFFLPGDFCDLNIYFTTRMDHSIGALTAARYYEIAPQQFHAVIEQRPHLLRALLGREISAAAIQREWLLSLGRRSPRERIAHLFVELFYRLDAVGLAHQNAYDLPVTQTHLAEANGLSLVHVNRTIQDLRREELVTLTDRRLTILDLDRLKQVAMFSGTYLDAAH